MPGLVKAERKIHHSTACLVSQSATSKGLHLSAGVKTSEQPDKCDGRGATMRAVCPLRNLVACPAQVEHAELYRMSGDCGLSCYHGVSSLQMGGISLAVYHVTSRR